MFRALIARSATLLAPRRPAATKAILRIAKKAPTVKKTVKGGKVVKVTKPVNTSKKSAPLAVKKAVTKKPAVKKLVTKKSAKKIVVKKTAKKFSAATIKPEPNPNRNHRGQKKTKSVKPRRVQRKIKKTVKNAVAPPAKIAAIAAVMEAPVLVDAGSVVAEVAAVPLPIADVAIPVVEVARIEPAVIVAMPVQEEVLVATTAAANPPSIVVEDSAPVVPTLVTPAPVKAKRMPRKVKKIAPAIEVKAEDTLVKDVIAAATINDTPAAVLPPLFDAVEAVNTAPLPLLAASIPTTEASAVPATMPAIAEAMFPEDISEPAFIRA